MSDRLVLTKMIDDVPVEIYERTMMVPNPAVMMVPMPVVVETFYVVPAPQWPKVRIRARRGFGRLLYRFGRRPGVMLENMRFNEQFRVDCDDEDFAILLLSPEMQRFLLSKTNVDWSVGGGAIKLFYRGSLNKKRVARSLERLRRFRSLIDEDLLAFDIA